MQMFFSEAEKPNRKTPATISGRNVTSQFRVKHHGESCQVVRVIAESYPNGGGVVRVIVKSLDGEVLFDQHLYPEK